MWDQLVDQVPAAARLPLLVLVVALAGWGALYLAVLAGTRPLPVRPGPATQDLPGDEPPAVVSVLANTWSVTEDAAESTLLDLAARGYLELRQPDADARHTTVHVTAQDPRAAAAAAARQARVLRSGGGDQPLTAYERSVLDHVTGIAVGGVVPLTALTFRDEGRADAWAASFARAVLADARVRGLVQRRIPAWAVTLLGAAAVVPGLALAWFAWTADGRKDASALMTALVPLGVLSSVAGRDHGIRGTAAGRDLAARWLAVREYLEVDSSFAALPPAAVAVWDRYLAYGDALGVTHVASAVIDLGMGNRRRVWSSFGGQWHQVRVRYPGRASRYGATALAVVVSGLAQVALGYALLRVRGLDGMAEAASSPVMAGLLAAGLALLVRGGYRLVRALVDLSTTRTLTAEVLWVAPWKTRRQDETTVTTIHYLAVDDGTADRTTAWALPDGLPRPFRTGQVVELTVRPWTRRVTVVRPVPVPAATPAPAPAAPPATAAPATAATPVPAAVPDPVPGVTGVPGAVLGAALLAAGNEPAPAPATVPVPAEARPVDVRSAQTRPVEARVRRAPVPAPVQAPPLLPAAASSVAELVTADELSRWLGVPLDPGESLPLGPATSGWMYRCPASGGGAGPVVEAVLVTAGRGTADGMALERARRGAPVPGVGEEAYLVDAGAVARWGPTVVQVTVPPRLGVRPEAQLAALQAAIVRVAKSRPGR